MLQLGKGSEMAKIDVRQAYRNVPVHPRDRHLLGMEWQGRVLIDGALPFGLRSAPVHSLGGCGAMGSGKGRGVVGRPLH